MLQIIKRLEIIKSSILIEDIEIIELQIMKLNSLKIDENVQEIIKKLKNSEYLLALEKIESFISRYSGVVVYQDKELLSLKFSLKQLEIKLQELIEEKIEYLKNIEEFNKEYNLHLGDIIKTINSKKLSSYEDLSRSFDNIGNIRYISIEILRNNEIMGLNYEIN